VTLVDPVTGNASVNVLLGRGDGTFLPRTEYAVVAYTGAAVLHDLNRDGALDVAVGTGSYGTVQVLFGDGTGRLRAEREYTPGGSTGALVAGDFNGDGAPDLASGHGTSSITFLLNRCD